MAGGLQVDVSRELRYKGYANTAPNIVGVPMTQKKVVDWGFEGTSSLYGWSSTTGANGLTLTHSAVVDGGAMLMTLGAIDEDCGELYHNGQWSPYFNCGMQAKVKVSRITDIAVCVGFVDRYENVDNHIAIEVDNAALRDCSNVGDFAGMAFDTDATTAVWYGGVSSNGAEATPVAAIGSLAPVANTYFKVRVQTDSAGNVTFYYASGNTNNLLVPVGYFPAGIAYAVTNMLTPYVGVLSHTTSAAVCTVSRVTVWQDN